MGAQGEPHEITILNTWGIRIKDQYYHLVLTNRRIIASGAPEDTPRSVLMQDIRDIERATDSFGDPVLILDAPAVSGEIKKLVLRFPRTIFRTAEQQRNLWYTEIGRSITRPVTGSAGAGGSSDPSTPVFCTRCGKRVFPHSMFCSRCGSRIILPLIPPPARRDDRLQDRAARPLVFRGISPETERGPSGSSPEHPGFRTMVTLPASEPRKPQKKMTGSGLKKPAAVIGLILGGLVVVIAAVMTVTAPGSPGSDLTSAGLNIPLPGPLAVPLQDTAGTTGTGAETPEPSAQPGFTFAPGDPGAVLAPYPALYNAGDGAGLRALFSENLKSHYSLEVLNENLAAARSGGYVIEKIEVKDQIIEEESAVLDADMYWKTAKSSTIRAPKWFLLVENDQWKLDSVVFRP